MEDQLPKQSLPFPDPKATSLPTKKQWQVPTIQELAVKQSASGGANQADAGGQS